MPKKKKNSNYVTEKRELAKAEKERAKKLAYRKKIIKRVVIPAVALILAVCLVVGVGAIFGWWDYEPVPTHHAEIELYDYGTIHLELYADAAPITVANFIKLANEGYYEDRTFHRIIDGKLVQGGEGMGTPSIKGEFRLNGVRNRIRHERGVISMMRSDDYDSGADEFFIVHQNAPEFNGRYAAFGKVTSGMEIVDAMCENTEPYNDDGGIHPYYQPKIKSVTVHEVHD